ncbi:MAG: DUF802 domain-containing protein [Paraburkholderia sp.]|uniref:DUF802 domain-containing protein n=1 Tax=Paraburkholderia sp. TaxID=1926495 RepID=UPI001201B31E|nr:DUF802 domain-containing protein [Paraburkholderia sp.]TAM04066.1 MAG: DUF802 domain-containing protein [Paraburkholderia sp.]TAM30891.1 MAG: DUF802 domain-containing protein [Paraburkholderia sp.]
MSRFRFDLVVFLAGCAALCWIAFGYLGTNPLALAVTLLIGACYFAGALELWRYRQATATLEHAVTALAEPPATLGAWLERIDPGLRGPVRLRVEGARAALPGPALTPYLVGLLVLLGMLGTLLGMVATLKGTGAALESAVDPLAIRASLAAPVKGLGFAFGTSIAGVATSAMLGLLSALVRRQRSDAAQQLDTRIATTLRVFSHAHQREASFQLLQRQAEAMPVLVDRLQAMMQAIEQQSLALNERQIASQQQFFGKVEATYAELAASVARSLKDGAAESARAAGAAIRPAVESMVQGVKAETAALHAAVTQAVEQQMAGLSTSHETTAATVSTLWREALADHRQSSATLAADLRTSFEHYAATFEARCADLIDGVAARLDRSAGTAAENWSAALSQQTRANEQLAADHQQALSVAAATFEQHAAALLRNVNASHAQLQAGLVSQDEARLDAWRESVASMSATLYARWDDAAVQNATRQQAICDTLERTASAIAAQTQAQARDTVAEIARLVEAASEAPRAAAEVIAELRQKLSESMVRDTAMLEERSRLLATLETLLNAVNHASTQQRGAIDALVTTSAELFERVGAQFTERVESETNKLDGIAARITHGAVEVASLGDAFGASVQAFGESNAQLVEQLQRIEGALDKSLARSDEQLAYYVAQAREVVDLSMLSQKQIMEGLQQLAARRAAAGAEAA